MLKFLIGPALVGAGYAAGSYYGADAEQVVHRDPAATYSAFEDALANMRTAGTTSFEGGAPMSYEIKVDRTPNEMLAVNLFFGGRRGAEADIRFMPRNGGHDTLVTSQIHADRSVLRTALAGTDKARLAYAPDWMLNLSFRPLLQQLAQQIEKGERLRLDESGDPRAQWEANLSDEERGELSNWRQYQATQPAVDPDQAAQNYMRGNSS